MRAFKFLVLFCSLISFSVVSAHAKIKVVASIKPIHSLVAGVMQGVGQPELIIEGAGSPHTYAMKPSQAVMLQKANLIFWVGKDIESFLEKPLKTIGSPEKSVALLNAPGLVKYKFRDGSGFDSHDHGHDEHKDHGHDEHKDHGHKEHKDHGHNEHKDHGHKEHKDHGHKEHKDHGHKEHKDHDHGHDDHKKHAHDKHGHDEKKEHKNHDHGKHEDDPHVWLDPQNAKALVNEIEKNLSKADPANAKSYRANAKKLIEKLDTLTQQTTAALNPYKTKSFVVFHDAYQYFEKRFGLSATGSITVSPEVLPGAKRVKELHHKIEKLSAACVFSEPQFEPKIVKTLVRGTKARTGVLDPLGSDLEKGPNQYFNLIGNMANAFKNCFSDS